MAGEKKKKGPRSVIGLKCTVSGVVNYITTKNKNNTTDKVKLMKYSRLLKKRTMHVETSKLK